jgi:hypothetical protein
VATVLVALSLALVVLIIVNHVGLAFSVGIWGGLFPILSTDFLVDELGDA